MTEQYYFTIKEVAQIAQVHSQTVYRWLQRGVISGVQLGGRWRIPRPALNQAGITNEAIDAYCFKQQEKSNAGK